MNIRNITYQFLDLIEIASSFTPKDEPIRFDMNDEGNDFFYENNNDRFINILRKLEEVNVITVINEPSRFCDLSGNYKFSPIGNHLKNPDCLLIYLKRVKTSMNISLRSGNK